jgi:hypothetical protein
MVSSHSHMIAFGGLPDFLYGELKTVVVRGTCLRYFPMKNSTIRSLSAQAYLHLPPISTKSNSHSHLRLPNHCIIRQIDIKDTICNGFNIFPLESRTERTVPANQDRQPRYFHCRRARRHEFWTSEEGGFEVGSVRLFKLGRHCELDCCESERKTETCEKQEGQKGEKQGAGPRRGGNSFLVNWRRLEKRPGHRLR